MPSPDRSLPLTPHHPPPPVPGAGGGPGLPPPPATGARASAAGSVTGTGGGPGPDDDLRRIIDAAARLWEPLAAAAWAGFRQHGRGAVLLEEADLLAVRGDAADVPVTFLPCTIVHRGDDFRGMLLRSDPERQVMLIVRRRPRADGAPRPEGDELLLTLESGTDRPSPAECHARRGGDDASSPTPGRPEPDA